MKKITTIFTIFLLMLSLVSGFEDFKGMPQDPHPVGVKVFYNGFGIEGVNVNMINLRTDYSMSTLTNYAGEAQIQMTDFKVNNQEEFPYEIGDQIRVTISGGQSQTITLEGGKGLVIFDLEIEPEDWEPVKQCPDGSIVPLNDECPVVEEEPEEPKLDPNDEKTETSFDVLFGQEFTIEITNNNKGLTHLLDTEIECDGEDYNVFEMITLSGKVQTSIDDVDYIEPVLTFDEKSIIYNYIFDEPIDTSEFDSDDPLEIDFLGIPIKIIEATADKLIVQEGKEVTLDVGDFVTSDDKTIKIVKVTEGKARIDVSGVEETIEEGKTKTINDIEINVLEVWSDEDPAVTIMFGDDVRRSIDKNDGYIDEDDGNWIYDFSVVEGKLTSISLRNANDYTNIDDRKGFIPLKVGESIWTDNQFAQIRFDSIIEYDIIELEFELDEGYLYVSTNNEDLIVDNDEYDELYIDDEGFYDMDFEPITTDKVRIGDSNTYIELGNSYIEIDGELLINFDLSDILYFPAINPGFINDDDDTYLTHTGITFKDVEKCVDDVSHCEFTVGVPNIDEDIKATITVAVDGIIEFGEVEPVTPIGDKPDEPIDDELVDDEPEPDVKPGPEPTPEPEPDKPTPEPTPTPEPKSYGWILWLVGIIVILGLGWYFFLKKK